jgi:hypothetical protein
MRPSPRLSVALPWACDDPVAAARLANGRSVQRFVASSTPSSSDTSCPSFPPAPMSSQRMLNPDQARRPTWTPQRSAARSSSAPCSY